MALVWINISGNWIKACQHVNICQASESLNHWKKHSESYPFLRFLEVRPYFQGPLLLWVTLWGSWTVLHLQLPWGLKGWLCLSNHAPNNKRHLAWMSRLLLEGSKDLLHHQWWGVSSLTPEWRWSFFFENFFLLLIGFQLTWDLQPPGNLLLKTTNVTCMVGFPSMLFKTTWMHCHWTLCPSESRERHRPFLLQTMLAGIQPYKQQNWWTAMALVPMSLK